MRIAGPRLAGVLPAPVAIHFAEAQVLLGRRVVIVGTGDWAQAAGRVIEEPALRDHCDVRDRGCASSDTTR